MSCRHHIFLGNSYTRGYRVALHFTTKDSESLSNYKAIVEALCTYRMSFHSLVTDSPSWESVPKKDPFFRGVRVVPTVDDFIEAVKEDWILSKADIETYIRSSHDVSESKMGEALDRCNQACIRDLGYPLYDPDKRDCPTAHVLDRSISSNRILASPDGRAKLRIIDSVLATS